MDQYLFGFGAIVLSVGGVSMVIWPAAVVELDRDADEKSCLPTSAEIWQIRVVGGFLIAAGVFMLYALLTGMPGAEFNGV
jgi:hypothetical protein